MSEASPKNSGLPNWKSFAIATGMLLVAAVAINWASVFLSFKKEPVEIGMPLKSIPGQIGPWKQVFADRALDSEVEHTLGTKEYIMRQYVDTRLVNPELIEGIEDDSNPSRQNAARHALQEAYNKRPDAFVQFAVTYYTGMVDTVAHIPDRCYVADGFEPTQSPEVVTWTAAGKPIRARFINFEDQTRDRGKLSRNVGYFFHVNGAYEHDPLTGVRLRLQNLWEKHAYYAKIEMMVEGVGSEPAKKVMADFLNSALPDIERCMPDWQKIKAQEAAKH